jgi:dienelactone hydrolase
MQKMIGNVLISLLPSLLIVGCSTASSSFANKASQSGFQTHYLQGASYRHTFYKNSDTHNKGILHVYLGGDGTPWFEGRYITKDPTPLKPVMLDLMKRDKTPSIYLGRPCYHQFKMPANCDNSLWTNKRYSQKVVNSMVIALTRYIERHNISHIRLFGFSGGGALAMLIAPHITQVKQIVTLAGNLDTEAWASYHGYTPLIGSLNPATSPPLSSHIQQLHLVGDKDKNIPFNIIKASLKRQHNAKVMRLKQADHHCCWSKYWDKVLNLVVK